MIELTLRERERFAAYLEQEAKSDNGIAEQLNTLRKDDPVAKRYRLIGAARLIISQDLRRIEEQTL